VRMVHKPFRPPKNINNGEGQVELLDSRGVRSSVVPIQVSAFVDENSALVRRRPQGRQTTRKLCFSSVDLSRSASAKPTTDSQTVVSLSLALSSYSVPSRLLSVCCLNRLPENYPHGLLSDFHCVRGVSQRLTSLIPSRV